MNFLKSAYLLVKNLYLCKQEQRVLWGNAKERRRKKLARFQIVHLLLFLFMLSFCNQPITFASITFMRRFAIFARQRTSVSTAQRRTRYYTTYRPRPNRKNLSANWWSSPRRAMPHSWDVHHWVRVRKRRRCLSQPITPAKDSRNLYLSDNQ